MPRFWIFFLLLGFSLIEAQEESDPAQVSVKLRTRENPEFLDSLEADSCISYANCTECNAASWCHWCSNKKACHVMGSVYGCAWGSSCEPPPDKKKNDTKTGCATHDTCSECALSSHLCHWCAFDNACHAIGSPYGCVSGTDCYSNDRCKRIDPEPFHRGVFSEIATNPLIAIIVVASTLFCCCSLCFCVFGCVKGAYDDLAELTLEGNSSTLTEPLLVQSRNLSSAPESEVEPIVDATPDSLPETVEEQPTEVADTDENDQGGAVDPDAADGDDEEGYVQMVAGSSNGEETPLVRSRRRPRYMQCMYRTCCVGYLVSVTLIAAFVVASIRYFPAMPVYNICNDSVAWKALIDSLAALQPSADFQILASIGNPNAYDIVVDQGGGNFSHNGDPVGSFSIPPTVVKAKSITDVLVLADIKPEHWQALSLTREYYRGTLVLNVDCSVSVRVPMFFNFSTVGGLQDLEVHVNELSDRSLCHCPTWSDQKNMTMIDLLSINH